MRGHRGTPTQVRQCKNEIRVSSYVAFFRQLHLDPCRRQAHVQRENQGVHGQAHHTEREEGGQR